MLEKILAFVFPAKCPFCGTITNGEDNAICETCLKNLPEIKEPRCKKCGKPILVKEKEYCYDCTKTEHFFEEGRSIWIHKPPITTAIYALKYKNKRIYAKTFGSMLYIRYGTYLIKHKIDLIIPIPLHEKRRKRRGFNQAELIAIQLGKYTRIPVDLTSLTRVHETIAQKNLNDRKRKQNIKGAFAAKRAVKGKRIVLIDDIYTTGATIDEAARKLRRAGAEKVLFLTISIGQGI